MGKANVAHINVLHIYNGVLFNYLIIARMNFFVYVKMDELRDGHAERNKLDTDIQIDVLS